MAVCLAIISIIAAASFYSHVRAMVFFLRDQEGQQRVTETSEPELLQLVERARIEMRVKSPIKVHLTPGCELYMAPVRRVLVIGILLVMSLDKVHLYALIRHELGHLKPGGTNYVWALRRIRDTSMRLVAFVERHRDERSFLFPSLFITLGPTWVAARCFRWLTEQLASDPHELEFAADRHAAQGGQPEDLGDALVVLAVIKVLWEQYGHHSALDLIDGIRQGGSPEKDVGKLINERLELTTPSHPSIAKRREILGLRGRVRSRALVIPCLPIALRSSEVPRMQDSACSRPPVRRRGHHSPQESTAPASAAWVYVPMAALALLFLDLGVRRGTHVLGNVAEKNFEQIRFGDQPSTVMQILRRVRKRPRIVASSSPCEGESMEGREATSDLARTDDRLPTYNPLGRRASTACSSDLPSLTPSPHLHSDTRGERRDGQPATVAPAGP